MLDTFLGVIESSDMRQPGCVQAIFRAAMLPHPKVNPGAFPPNAAAFAASALLPLIIFVAYHLVRPSLSVSLCMAYAQHPHMPEYRSAFLPLCRDSAVSECKQGQPSGPGVRKGTPALAIHMIAPCYVVDVTDSLIRSLGVGMRSKAALSYTRRPLLTAKCAVLREVGF